MKIMLKLNKRSKTEQKPIQQVTERHLRRMRRTKGEVKKMHNCYDNIDTVQKQNVLENIVQLMEKGNLPTPQNSTRIGS